MEPVTPHQATLRVKVEGAVVEIPRKPRRERKGPRTPGEKATARILEGAKRRALAELRDRHVDEYLDLLARERAKLGLEPYPVQWLRYKTVNGTEV
jgi:hypothetical protein